MSDPASAPTRPQRPVDPGRVRSLFDAALDRPAADRAAFLAEACGADDDLAAEVGALLAFADGPAPAVAAGPDDAPGDGADAEPATIGRFTVLGKLGQGGMGVVYRARDPALDREIAIKLVAHAGRDAHARLLREAQAMARLAHPNVVPVHEVGVHGDGLFVAMELVRGTTLTAWLRAEPRPWRDVLRRLVDAGRGLAAAHRAGLLHRDVKPDNILVGEDGRARVVDFGLARAAAAPEVAGTDDDADATGALDLPLTRAGAVVGTPGFMSPEHFDGALTPLADQWSFAVTAFYALLGRLPFAGDDLRALRDATRTAAPDVPPLGDVPPAVVDVVLRGMRPLPEDRFPTLDALLDRLDAQLAVDPRSDPATFRRQRRALAIGVAALGTANFAAAGVRSDLRFDLGVRGVLVQGLVGLAVLVLGAIALRRALWRTGHDRRVMLLMLLVMGTVSAHRAVSLHDDVVTVLRGDAVFVTALLVLGAVTLERWLLASAAVMVAYLGLTYAAPGATVGGFGPAIIATIALGIWFWREPARPPHVGGSRSGSASRPGRRRSRTTPPRM